MDVFDAEGVRFGLEVHPTEIAYDFVTTRKALEAIGNRPGFGINFDPSHFDHQFLDSAAFIHEFADRIYHVHVKDSKRTLDGRSSILGGAPELRRAGRAAGTSSRRATATSTSSRSSARSTGSATRGRSRSSGRTAGMDREWGAPDALAFVRRTDFAPSTVAFDAAFAKEVTDERRSASSPMGQAGGTASSGRSASACSATPSWARRTRTPTGRSPT